MRFFSLFIAIYLFNMATSVAYNNCNTNDNCRGTWVCVGGTASNNSNAQPVFTGVCKPNIVMKQVCLLYNLVTGVFGKGMTLLAIAAFGGQFFVKEVGGVDGIKWREFLALTIGIAFIFGAPSIINLITKSNTPFCQMKN